MNCEEFRALVFSQDSGKASKLIGQSVIVQKQPKRFSRQRNGMLFNVQNSQPPDGTAFHLLNIKTESMKTHKQA